MKKLFLLMAIFCLGGFVEQVSLACGSGGCGPVRLATPPPVRAIPQIYDPSGFQHPLPGKYIQNNTQVFCPSEQYVSSCPYEAPCSYNGYYSPFGHVGFPCSQCHR